MGLTTLLKIWCLACWWLVRQEEMMSPCLTDSRPTIPTYTTSSQVYLIFQIYTSSGTISFISPKARKLIASTCVMVLIQCRLLCSIYGKACGKGLMSKFKGIASHFCHVQFRTQPVWLLVWHEQGNSPTSINEATLLQRGTVTLATLTKE